MTTSYTVSLFKSTYLVKYFEYSGGALASKSLRVLFLDLKKRYIDARINNYSLLAEKNKNFSFSSEKYFRETSPNISCFDIS